MDPSSDATLNGKMPFVSAFSLNGADVSRTRDLVIAKELARLGCLRRMGGRFGVFTGGFWGVCGVFWRCFGGALACVATL